MKYLLITLTLLLSGCASTIPDWQYNLNTINRQWREPMQQREVSLPEIPAYKVAGICTFR